MTRWWGSKSVSFSFFAAYLVWLQESIIFVLASCAIVIAGIGLLFLALIWLVAGILSAIVDLVDVLLWCVKRTIRSITSGRLCSGVATTPHTSATAITAGGALGSRKIGLLHLKLSIKALVHVYRQLIHWIALMQKVITERVT